MSRRFSQEVVIAKALAEAAVASGGWWQRLDAEEDARGESDVSSSTPPSSAATTPPSPPTLPRGAAEGDGDGRLHVAFDGTAFREGGGSSSVDPLATQREREAAVRDAMQQWWEAQSIDVGDVVVHPTRGRGVVRMISTFSTEEMRVHVEFSGGEVHRYRQDSWFMKMRKADDAEGIRSARSAHLERRASLGASSSTATAAPSAALLSPVEEMDKKNAVRAAAWSAWQKTVARKLAAAPLPPSTAQARTTTARKVRRRRSSLDPGATTATARARRSSLNSYAHTHQLRADGIAAARRRTRRRARSLGDAVVEQSHLHGHAQAPLQPQPPSSTTASHATGRRHASPARTPPSVATRARGSVESMHVRALTLAEPAARATVGARRLQRRSSLGGVALLDERLRVQQGQRKGAGALAAAPPAAEAIAVASNREALRASATATARELEYLLCGADVRPHPLPCARPARRIRRALGASSRAHSSWPFPRPLPSLVLLLSVVPYSLADHFSTSFFSFLSSFFLTSSKRR
jgi:hypothetical protein